MLQDFTVFDALDSNNRVSLETFRPSEVEQDYHAAGDAYAASNDLEDDEDDDPLEEDTGQNIITTSILEVKKERDEHGKWLVEVSFDARYGIKSEPNLYPLD